jgi:hypothetical protein
MVKLMTAYPVSGYSIEDVNLAADLVKKCLKWVPSERITAEMAI